MLFEQSCQGKSVLELWEVGNEEIQVIKRALNGLSWSFPIFWTCRDIKHETFPWEKLYKCKRPYKMKAISSHLLDWSRKES